jgi:hypothetical protein
VVGRGLLAVVLGAVLGAVPAAAACPGDCNGDGVVTVAEMVTVVNIAIGDLAPAACPDADVDGDGSVAIGETILAVQAALAGCPTPPVLCPAVQVASGDGVTLLAGPGLLVQPGGGFVVATASTTVTTGTPSRARGEVTVHRYAADGALLGENRLASRQQVIVSPMLARLPNGGGMAAWGEANPRQFESPITRLAVRRFGSNGSALGGVALAARARSGVTFNPPSLTADASGNALLSWMELAQTSAGGTVFQALLREQRPSGLRPAQPVSCFGNPVAVSTGAQLGVVCVAFDVVPAQQIALRAFALDQGAVVPLFDFASAASPFSAVAAAASSDRIVAAWRQPLASDSSRSELIAQVVGLDGATIAGPLTIATTLQTAATPAVAVLADGAFAVAFGENPLQLWRFAADGSPLGAPLPIADTFVDALALDGDAAGNLVVAWRWGSVFARRVPAPGGACQ